MNISRKTLLKSIFGSLIAAPIFAKAGDNELLIDIRNDLKNSFKNSAKYTLTVFNQMPEDKLEWKYTPESFSFRTQFVHCITFTASQLCGRLNLKNPYDAKKKEYWAAQTKAELETDLKEFYNWLEKTVDELSDETLLKKESFVGGDMPNWKILMAMENHIIHHRGQAICYLRLNGITPVGYIGWA